MVHFVLQQQEITISGNTAEVGVAFGLKVLMQEMVMPLGSDLA